MKTRNETKKRITDRDNVGDNRESEESEEDEENEETELFILQTREKAWQELMYIMARNGSIKTIRT